MKEVTITAFRRDMLFEIRDLPFVVMKEGEPLFVVSAPGDKLTEVFEKGKDLTPRHALTDICKVHNRPYKDCGCSLWS